MSRRVINFCPGPATIAEPVLQRAQRELLDWQGRGVSVMEISHRGADFIEQILTPAEQNLRQLLNIPANYRVLFIAGGASQQFSMVPLNLLGLSLKADYFHTGIWSGKAIAEAQRYGKINIVTDSTANNFTDIASPEYWQLDTEAAYVHYTPNETIQGLEFHQIPSVGKVPLVADMSSTILSRPLDIAKFGLIYASAQKNIGPAGLTLVIIREDLLGKALSFTPRFDNYQTYAEHHSLSNTPPTFSIYLANLTFEWLIEQGGLAAIATINQRKADRLYQAIDDSDGFYRNAINPLYRSWMNVVFNLATSAQEQLFVQQAALQDLVNLKGHKLVGGIRASIYNALPEAGVDALITFMQDFQKKHG